MAEVIEDQATDVETKPQDPRMEGAKLVVRTVNHHVNNKLGILVGALDMVAQDPATPPHLKEFANKALKDEEELETILGKLSKIKRLVEIPAREGIPPYLDLDRSIESDDSSEAK